MSNENESTPPPAPTVPSTVPSTEPATADPFLMIVEQPASLFKKSDQQMLERRDNRSDE